MLFSWRSNCILRQIKHTIRNLYEILATSSHSHPPMCDRRRTTTHTCEVLSAFRVYRDLFASDTILQKAMRNKPMWNCQTKHSDTVPRVHIRHATGVTYTYMYDAYGRSQHAYMSYMSYRCHIHMRHSRTTVGHIFGANVWHMHLLYVILHRKDRPETKTHNSWSHFWGKFWNTCICYV